MSQAASLRLGVLIPSRNEAQVIERRLVNLVAATWPATLGGAHRILVVDDGSSDGTAGIAREFLAAGGAAAAGLACEVISNVHAPGKSGAMRAGLERLGEDVDIVVLTDADVLTDPGALVAIAEAFYAEPALGMVCGVQSLHERLPEDGRTPLGEGGMGLYDSWTRGVRRAESRAGRLFSVHGQLLAWRTELGLTPSVLAADDLELMLELRQRYPERTVRMIEGARFHEERSSASEEQDLRRARAYMQALPLMARREYGLQGWFYRNIPPRAPALALLGLALLGLVAWWFGGGVGVFGSALCVLLGLTSPSLRRLVQLLWVIERARRLEGTGSASAVWETARA